MKKLAFIIGILSIGFLAQAQQLKYGFSAPKYDNFNNTDPSAAFEVIVLIPNNDTLKTTIGSTISPIDGTAKSGTHYNFTQTNFTFAPGATNWNNSNRKSFSLNLTPDPVYWGTRSFTIKLTNFIGMVPADQLINNQDELIIIIDYDGSSLNVPKLSVHDYRLFPVPATDKIYIDGVNAEGYLIKDLSGRMVQQGTVFENTVDVNNLSNGIYIFQAKTSKGFIIHKFIKE